MSLPRENVLLAPFRKFLFTTGRVKQEFMGLTERQREWLDWLKQGKRRQITQRQAAEQMEVSERWVRKLLVRMKVEKDGVVIHKLSGRSSNRRRSASERDRIIKLRSEPLYAGYGPTLASERLQQKHDIRIGREAFWGTGAMGQFHPRLAGRQRRALEADSYDRRRHQPLTPAFCRARYGRGKFPAAGALAEEVGRMLGCSMDKSALFLTTEKRRRDRPGEELEARQMPPTQIGRALAELGITLTWAHSPQAK